MMKFSRSDGDETLAPIDESVREMFARFLKLKLGPGNFDTDDNPACPTP